MPLPKPTLQKSIFRIDFPPRLEFYDLLYPASEKLNEYKDWETDKLSLALMDLDHHCSVILKHNSISYEQDSDDKKLLEERLQKLILTITEVLKIKSMTRIGFREQYLIPSDLDFNTLTKLLEIKLFNQEPMKKIFPQIITDLLYRVYFLEDQKNIYVTAGAVRKQEIPNHIRYNIQKHLRASDSLIEFQKIINAYPEVALLVDLDVHTAKIKDVEEIIPFKGFARHQIDSILTKFNTYMFSTKVSTS